ncbi:cytochrome c oxidase subunit II [Sphingomonas sp. HHU CXW]|uniref:Cytochrome aa3 subunit 2 n=2 Tax=Sphingomonas hominis TaxID=2741495 RepID=A0ABX2JGN7_9SPHN|nr:cytochrome c oxidase subunit II [Sphingomonas hominis]
MSRQSALSTFGVEAANMRDLTMLMTVCGVLIFVIVAALFTVAIRSKGGAIDHRGGMRLVLWAGAVLPTIVLAALLIGTLPAMRPIRANQDALLVDVAGEQFWWRVGYRVPGGEAISAANEVRIPVGRTVDFRLSASDVIHSFWIPGLAGKVDMIPGRTNRLVARATKAGRYRGQCAEFCGLSHALMAFDVIAMDPAAFDRWLADQRRAAPAPTDAVARRGAELFADAGCGGCHAIAGTAAAGRIGPDFSHIAARTSLGAGIMPMTTPNLVRFIRNAPAVKPGARMPRYTHLAPADTLAIARYLETLK